MPDVSGIKIGKDFENFDYGKLSNVSKNPEIIKNLANSQHIKDFI